MRRTTALWRGLPRLGRCRIYEGEVFGRSGGRAGKDLKISWCGGVDRSWGRGWGRGWGWGWAGAGREPAGKVVPRVPLKSRVLMGEGTQMTPPGIEPTSIPEEGHKGHKAKVFATRPR